MNLEVAMRDLVRDAFRDEFREQLRSVLREELRAALEVQAGTRATLDYLTVAEAADFAKIAIPTLREWIKEGRLRASRPGGGRQYRIARADLLSCLAATALDERTSSATLDEMAEDILGSLSSATHTAARREG